ncbi:MAG: AMP-binding protein, partial [Desulfobacula sp.]|nr:AMP-binding protein [Desulfobacula sp.]
IDDIFNLNQKNSSAFFELLIKHNFDVQLYFSNGMRGDILTKDYIDLMVKAGTILISLSLETASPRLQKLIRKNLDLENLHDNFQYISKTYPHVILDVNVMHGFPTESKEEALLTLDFIKSIKWLHFPALHILKIYQNTDMEQIAIKNGISEDAIARSVSLAFHELPETLPYDKNFTLQCQSEFADYFLSKERLLHVLPYQMKAMTEDEIMQKYDSYLPIDINSFSDLLEFANIQEHSINTNECLSEHSVSVNNFNQKLRSYFPETDSSPNALKILLLDLSQFFKTKTGKMLYDVVEPPLGLMHLMTFLNEHFGEKVCGKIAKSRIDFDNYSELKKLLMEFKPDVIGIRTLTFYKDFFHKTVALIKHWGVKVPILAGGPYATSDYIAILQDPYVNLVVLGEGEITFGEIIEKMIENEGKLPEEKVLQEIPGIAFIPEQKREQTVRAILMLDELSDVLSKEPINTPVSKNYTDNLAYAVYTSGSTGKPKGTLISHSSLLNLVFWHIDAFNISSSDRATQLAGTGFDASVWEIWP